MLKHLLENNLNTPDQYGFTKGRSYLTNLLKTFESWAEDVDQGHSYFSGFSKRILRPKKDFVADIICY